MSSNLTSGSDAWRKGGGGQDSTATITMGNMSHSSVVLLHKEDGKLFKSLALCVSPPSLRSLPTEKHYSVLINSHEA